MGNDVSIIAGIIGILVIIGIFMPLFSEALGVDTGDNPTFTTPSDPLHNDSAVEEYARINQTNWYPLADSGNLKLIKSVGVSFFWIYDWFPFWLIALHVMIRIIGGILIYRLIRSGGG